MSQKKKISKAVVSRLPRYYRYLGECIRNGVDRISSEELGRKMHITASQIRQDFNNFGGFGHQGYGYNIEYLYGEIGKILGLEKPHQLGIIGAGHIGYAIAVSAELERQGFFVNAIFDKDEEKIGAKILENTILSIDNLEEELQNKEIDIAVICVPKSVAQLITNRVVEAGIKAIWNFANWDINVPDDVVVANEHFADTLMRITFRMAEKDNI